MHFTVIHQPTAPHSEIAIHAWEPGGSVYDASVKADADGRYTFTFAMNVKDPRTIAFKFRYIDGAKTVWETDDFVRYIPKQDDNQTVWTFDHTARCVRYDPLSSSTASLPQPLTFNLITKQQLSGGNIYIWQPGTNNEARFGQTGRIENDAISIFTMPFADWMKKGFYFKFYKDQYWEPERSNKIWFPTDGSVLYLKGGQISIRQSPFQLIDVNINLLHSQSAPLPVLRLDDMVETFSDPLPVVETIAFDSDLLQTQYRAKVYPNALYNVVSDDKTFYSALRVWQDDQSLVDYYGIYGNPGLTNDKPMRDAVVNLVIQRNPNTGFTGDINVDVHLGAAPLKLAPLGRYPYLRTTAQWDSGANEWHASFTALSNLPQSLSISAANGMLESRIDGPLEFQRSFQLPSGTTTLYTVDGIGGLSTETPSLFQDVSIDERRRLMKEAFGEAIVNNNVFRNDEMPLGALVASDATWFILNAPHAVTAELILMDTDPSILTNEAPEYLPYRLPKGRAKPKPAYKIIPMASTNDLRYWWVKVATDQAPHGTAYRFRLNGPDGVEIIDPAARWLIDTGGFSIHDDDRVTNKTSGTEVNPGTIVDDHPRYRGSFGLVLDLAKLNEIMANSNWRTRGWESFLIYEMHALRLTRRYGDDLCAFDRVINELQPDRYLHKLPVTELELLPVHEFPQKQSWGYNPSLFFAIDSFYGGPIGLARCIRAAHDAGKGVILDLVYNHMVDSPLQTIAPDVYVDGATKYGDMVNYDHPAVLEYFRQATVYLWRLFRIDGFRFDCTLAIVNGAYEHEGVIDPGCGGSGGGWEYLAELRKALHRSAEAVNEPWPYMVGENNPMNDGLSKPSVPGVMDGQWHFEEYYQLSGMAYTKWNMSADELAYKMVSPQNQLRPFYESLRFGESHDSCSEQDPKDKRIAARPEYMQGLQMAKAVASVAILGNGIPMLFMGQEAGEDKPFAFNLDGLQEDDRYINIDSYMSSADIRSRVLLWCTHLMGLRLDSGKGLCRDDNQYVCKGNRTIAFTRAGGRIFVVVTFGTPNKQQNSAWLGLPGNASYKEIFNSSWPDYQVEFESEATNGGYNANIYSGNILSLPYIGCVVLERR